MCQKHRMLYNTANLGASPNPSLAPRGPTRSVGLLNSNSIFRCIFQNILQKLIFFLFCKETYTRANQGALQDRLLRRGLCVQRLGFFFYQFSNFLKNTIFYKETYKGATQDFRRDRSFFALFSLLFRSASVFFYH